MLRLALCLIVLLTGCKTGEETSEVQSVPPHLDTQTPHHAVDHKLRCRVDVAAGKSHEKRVDYFLFGDPSSSEGAVYWNSWGGVDSMKLITINHQKLQCDGCFQIEARTDGDQSTFFNFEIRKHRKGTSIKVQSKTPVGGPQTYGRFGLKDGECAGLKG